MTSADGAGTRDRRFLWSMSLPVRATANANYPVGDGGVDPDVAPLVHQRILDAVCGCCVKRKRTRPPEPPTNDWETPVRA